MSIMAFENPLAWGKLMTEMPGPSATEPPSQIRDRLIDAALVHVAFDGWSEATLRAALRDTGSDESLGRAAFPRGPVDMALAFHARGDREMVRRIRATDMNAMRFRDRIALAIRLRLEAIEDKEEFDPEEFFPPGEGYYLLRVKGDSMIGDHIQHGDLVLVEPRQMADDGETVVAVLSGGEATLKRFYREGGRFRLQPSNPDLDPIYVDEVAVRGVVRGVLRRY